MNKSPEENMNKLPKARNRDIVVQTLGKETLIYDLQTHKAYNLNETSAIVYQACDGNTLLDELRVKSKFTDDIIFLALDKLKKENLIEEDNSFVSPFDGMSRREAIRKVGLASMIALPVISSLTAPTAAMAQSTTCRTAGQTCTPSSTAPGNNNCCANLSCNIGGNCIACTTTGNNPGLFCAGSQAACESNCQNIAFNCCSGNIDTVPNPGGGFACVCAA
jgi:hypothetical protein